MKTLALTLVTFLLLFSCEEENLQPAQDPFVGSWKLTNIQTGLDVSFNIKQDGEALTINNISIEYPEIPDGQQLEYHAELSGRFAVNAGYEEIKIFASGDTAWIILTMDHNRVHLKTDDQMDVAYLKIEMVNREPVELFDQKFTRKRL